VETEGSSKAGIVVGRGEREDVEWIARFQVAMARETESLTLEEPTVQAGVGRILQEPDRGFYAVARAADGTPVGCVLVLKEWSDWRNGEVWWMHSVYVSPVHRNQGVFRLLFQHVEGWARSSGVRGLRLYVERANHRAKAVYARMGMGDDHYELFEKMF
jgi:GNAT superfamily N-acetyltransferase